jgi:hypothetical protein
MKQNKAIKVGTDAISAAYKATTIKAAEDMPAEGTLGQRSIYVYDQLEAAHPEVVWGVVLVKYTPGKFADTA